MQLVVVSPLLRALETAAGIFGVEIAEGLPEAAEGGQDPQQQATDPQQLQHQDGGGHGGGGSSVGGEESMDLDSSAQSPLLMRAQSKERNQRTAHAAVGARPGVQFVAVELCRERLGRCSSVMLCRATLLLVCSRGVSCLHALPAAARHYSFVCRSGGLWLVPSSPTLRTQPWLLQAPPNATSGKSWKTRSACSQR